MGLVMPEAGTIFWMLIVFSIVVFILRKFAWKPILNALKDREESIAQAINSAEKAREEVAGLKADNEKIIIEARKEKDIILKEAKEIKEKILSEAKIIANQETQKSIENARIQIQTEKNSAIGEMKKQMAELSVLIAEKVIRKELSDPDKQDKMIDDLIDDIKLN